MLFRSEAALIQGFSWEIDTYDFDDGTRVILHLDEITYHILIARYKELAKGGGGGRGNGAAYDIDIHITEFDTAKIDADYMNSKFDIFLKLIQGDYDQDAFDKTLKELHKSFSMLSQDEQKYANIFIHDVRSGNAVLDPGKTFRDYITEYMHNAEVDQIKKISLNLGVDEIKLRKLMSLKVNENNLDEFGRFNELIKTADTAKAKLFFEQKQGKVLSDFEVNIKTSRLLRKFILVNGFDIDEI